MFQKHFPTLLQLSEPGVAWRSTPIVLRDNNRLVAYAFLQLLQVVHKSRYSGEETASILEAFAREHRGRARCDALRIASQVRKGSTLLTAIERSESLVSRESKLAIRFGVQTGTLTEVYRDLIESERTSIEREAHSRRKSLPYWGSLAIVLFLVWAFLMIRIYPIFVSIFNDFELKLPWVLRRLGALWELVVGSMPYLVLLGIALLIVSMSSLTNRWVRPIRDRIFQRIPFSKRSPITFQLLGISLQQGRPLASSLSSLAKYHFDPSMRQRLLIARNDMEQGSTDLQCLRDSRLLTADEVQAIELLRTPSHRAYFLKDIAVREQLNAEKSHVLHGVLLEPIVTLAFGLFVLWVCFAFFAVLISLVTSLS